MSKSSLSALKSEINMEMKSANSVISDLKGLEGSVYKAMEDRVGRSAMESVSSIQRTLSYGVENGYKSANNAVNAMERGYGKIDVLSGQGDKLLNEAKAILKELGDV